MPAIKKKTAGLLCLFTISFLLFARPHALAQSCPVAQTRVYANSQTIAVTSLLNLGLNPGSVTDAALAANGVPTDYSILDGGLSGSATQFLRFAQVYHVGKSVTVKLTVPSGLLSVLGNVTVQPFLGAAHTAVGPSVSGTTLVNLLSGTGDDEITISPNADFDGVSVSIGGISVDQSLNVYDAYITQDASGNIGCNTPIDVLSGNKPISNLANIGTVLGAVSHPEWAIDNSLTSFAEIKAVASVLSKAYHTTVFNSLTHKGDTVKMILQNSGTALLNLDVGSGFTVKLYNGTAAVETITYDIHSLELKLFALASDQFELDISPPSDIVYDRVEVSVGGIASVSLSLTGLKIYDVERVLATPIINNSLTPTTTTICEGNTTTLTVSNPQECTTYKWYDAAVGGNVLYTGISYPLPNTPTNPLTTGTHIYYVEATRDGCTETSTRAMASVIVNATPNIMPGTIADICTGVITTALPYTNAVGSPTTYSIAWDASTPSFANVVDAAFPNTTTGTIAIAVPSTAAGTYTGKLTLKNASLCPSADIPITVKVNSLATPPVINISN